MQLREIVNYSDNTTRFPDRLSHHEIRQRLRIGHRCFAGEIFANVGSGFAIDRRHRADGLVLFRKEFLAVAAVGKNQDLVRE